MPGRYYARRGDLEVAMQAKELYETYDRAMTGGRGRLWIDLSRDEAEAWVAVAEHDFAFAYDKGYEAGIDVGYERACEDFGE